MENWRRNHVAAHTGLSCVALNKEQASKTCGPYYYLVQSGGCTAHTAFCTKAELERWLEERGLTCEIPTCIEVEDYGKGLSNYAPILGVYGEVMHWNKDEFYALPAVVRSWTLSNGDVVEALITEEDGVRVVNTLNPNVKDRKTLDRALRRLS